MKLAYFSPMPPARTGIATYSAQLLKALVRHCDVTVFAPNPDAAPIEGASLVRFGGNPAALEAMHRHDHALFHIGNNPWFHLDIWKAFQAYPRSVCLHDVVIYYLIAGMGRGALAKELFLADPDNALANLVAIEAACPEGDLLRYPTPSRHPCILGLLESAPHVFVHNESSATGLRELGYSGRVDVIPHLHYTREHPPASHDEALATRDALGYGGDDFVLGTFGFIGPTKRLESLLRAVAQVRDRGLPRRVRLLVVGEGEPLDGLIDELGLHDLVTRTGFVGDVEFRRYLCAVDAIANLRYPSHGESSGSLVQAMSYGKACLVTDHASFGEMPDETVVKVPYDEREIPALVAQISRLAGAPEAIAAVGNAARDHIARVHDPDTVAKSLLRCLAATRPPRELGVVGGTFDTGFYLRDRIASAVP